MSSIDDLVERASREAAPITQECVRALHDYDYKTIAQFLVAAHANILSKVPRDVRQREMRNYAAFTVQIALAKKRLGVTNILHMARKRKRPSDFGRYQLEDILQSISFGGMRRMVLMQLHSWVLLGIPFKKWEKEMEQHAFHALGIAGELAVHSELCERLN